MIIPLLKEVTDYKIYCEQQGTCPRPYGAFYQEIAETEMELGGWSQPMLNGVQLYRKPWDKHKIISGLY